MNEDGTSKGFFRFNREIVASRVVRGGGSERNHDMMRNDERTRRDVCSRSSV